MNNSMLTETMREWYDKTPDSVHGVQYGYKITNGKITDELCVVFSVLNKKPLAELTQEEILPTSLVVDNETIKTDVVQMGLMSLCTHAGYGRCSQEEVDRRTDSLVTTHRARVRPLRGGISIGNNEDAPGYGNAGTLGGLFRDVVDGSVVGLTNAHVACKGLRNCTWSDSSRTVGDVYNNVDKSPQWDIMDKKILQPGTIDGGNSTTDIIGRVKRYYPLDGVDSTNPYNYIDAAVIGIDNATLLDSYSGSQRGPTPPVNYSVATTAEINVLFTKGYALVKSGRTTGYVNALVGGNCGIPSDVTAVPFDYGYAGKGSIRLLFSPIGNYNTVREGVSNEEDYTFSNVLSFVFNAAAQRSTGDLTYYHCLPNVCVPGDSGSLLLANFVGLDPDGDYYPDGGVLKIVGLIFATGTTDNPLSPYVSEFPNNVGSACRIDTVMEQLQLEPIGSKERKVNPSTNWLFKGVPRPTTSGRQSPKYGIMVDGVPDLRTYWECGQRETNSGTYTVYVTYVERLSAPRNVVAAIGNASLVVSWDAPYSNGGSPITDYIVKYSSNGGVAMSWKNFSDPVSTATSCTVTGLINGTPYVFKVIAKNAVGISPASANSQPVTPATVPGSPTGVAAVRGNASLTVTWAAPVSTGGSPITDYAVEYSSNSGSTFTSFAHPASTATSLAITGLTNGTAYVIKVIARNAIGTSLPSANSAPVTPATVPGSPTGVVAVRGNSSLAVTWAAPANTGGSPLIDYLVKYSSNGGAAWTNFIHPVSTATSLTITGLANGTAYVIKVVAKNAVGIGPASANSQPVTPATVPGKPTSVVAKTGIANSLAVTWTAPESTGGSPITDYLVKYSSNSGATFTTFVRSVSTVPSVAVTGLTNGTPYVFKVIAKNAVDIGPPSANSAPATPLATVPGRPTSVVAVSGNSQLAVTWVAPTSTGGSNITAYIIKYSSNSGVTWQRSMPPSSAAPITATSYTITGLTNLTEYVIKVIAVNAIGISLPSVNSAPATPRASS